MHFIGPNDIESIEKKTLTFHAGYSCLTNMIYVLGLAISSKLCRGVYAVMLFTPLHIIITNVHNPDLILIVYMLSVTGRLATIK